MGSLPQFKEDGGALLRGHLSAGKGVGGVGLLKAGENADYSLHNLNCTRVLRFRLQFAEIQRRRLTQSEAAAILGIDQPKVSALKQGKLSGFSIERLMRLLVRLGRDVEITVRSRSKPGSAAKLHVA